MRTLSGKYECDKCGWDCGNGGVTACLVVSDITDGGEVVNHHFCRDEKDDDGKVTHKGCAKKVMSSTNLKHYLESQEKAE